MALPAEASDPSMGFAHSLFRPVGAQIHSLCVDEFHLRDAHQAEHGLEVGGDRICRLSLMHAAAEWLRKSFFGAKFVRDLFFGTFFFYFHFSLPKLLPVVNIYDGGGEGGGGKK